ncbi:MAG: hypothetical protein IBJ18_05355 [Phycisphaerales bacterium]|nr:hypothetical protein [Phycisphaerales bacterium]
MNLLRRQYRKLSRARKLAGHLRSLAILTVVSVVLQLLPLVWAAIDFAIVRPGAQALGTRFNIALFASLVLMIANFIVMLFVRWKVQKAVAQSQRLACIWCLYDLSGCEPHGRCPECGCLYRHSYVRKLWSKTPGV